MKMVRYLFAVVMMLAAVGLKAAEVTEHPLFKPLEGSVFDAENSSFSDYDSLKVSYRGESGALSEAEGQYWILKYQADGLSRSDIKDAVVAAMADLGAEVYEQKANRARFRYVDDEGVVSWVRLDVESRRGLYSLKILQELPLGAAVEFELDSFETALFDEGRASVYGLLFAPDGDRLLPGSGLVLDEIAEVLSSRSFVAIEIQGHTDNAGSRSVNNRLSKARAETVRDALILFGVDPGKVSFKGVSGNEPIADNETAAGRRMNRRIDFVMTEPVRGNNADADDPNAAEEYAEEKAQRAGDGVVDGVDRQVDRAVDRSVDSVLDRIF